MILWRREIHSKIYRTWGHLKVELYCICLCTHHKKFLKLWWVTPTNQFHTYFVIHYAFPYTYYIKYFFYSPVFIHGSHIRLRLSYKEGLSSIILLPISHHIAADVWIWPWSITRKCCWKWPVMTIFCTFLPLRSLQKFLICNGGIAHKGWRIITLLGFSCGMGPFRMIA